MSEDERTIWLGNLNSEKVTEDVLYELFLQAGPLDRIHIPKDRDGKQRNFAFVTYKHLASVPYAVTLFDGTMLFNRQVYMKARSNESQQNTNSTEQNHYQNELIQLGNQMLQCSPNPSLVYGNFPSPPMLMQQPNHLTPPQFYYNEERRTQQQNYGHPYQREPERNKSRHNNDYGHDKRRENNYSSMHRNNYRENSHYSQRHGGSRHESSSRESNNRHESSNRHDRRYYRS